MAGANDLAKMVPGFEFLQSLMKTASSALPGIPGLPGLQSVPGMSQWIAPTLDPEELDKRIQELKTVQFWLDSNARLLGTTVQALEVQRMTLATLKTMNMPLTDLRDALKIRPAAAPSFARTPAPEPEAESEPEPEPPPAARKKAAAARPAAPAPAVDPLQWWGALTQQFAEIAGKAVKDSAADAAKNLAGAAVRQTVASAGSTLKKAAGLPAQAAKRVAAGRKRGA